MMERDRRRYVQFETRDSDKLMHEEVNLPRSLQVARQLANEPGPGNMSHPSSQLIRVKCTKIINA